MISKMAQAGQILEEMAFQPVAGRPAKLLIETTQNSTQGAVMRNLTLDGMAARITNQKRLVEPARIRKDSSKPASCFPATQFRRSNYLGIPDFIP
jgi:hypothetical protein